MPVRTIGTAGVRTMGTGIAQVSAVRWPASTLASRYRGGRGRKRRCDPRPELRPARNRQNIAPAERDAALQRVARASGQETLRSTDLVVEVASNDRAIKPTILGGARSTRSGRVEPRPSRRATGWTGNEVGGRSSGTSTGMRVGTSATDVRQWQTNSAT
jgi:hypothetical protein